MGRCRRELKKCLDPESNQGHGDFQAWYASGQGPGIRWRNGGGRRRLKHICVSRTRGAAGSSRCSSTASDRAPCWDPAPWQLTSSSSTRTRTATCRSPLAPGGVDPGEAAGSRPRHERGPSASRRWGLCNEVRQAAGRGALRISAGARPARDRSGWGDGLREAPSPGLLPRPRQSTHPARRWLRQGGAPFSSAAERRDHACSRTIARLAEASGTTSG